MSDKNTKKPVKVSVYSVYEGPSAEEMDKDMEIWNKARDRSAEKVSHQDGILYTVEELHQMEYDD